MLCRPWLLFALAAAACGDNLLPDGEPLAHASDLTIVAHQDDDLLFIQPDLFEAVQHGTGLTNVYVTAGNGKRGDDAANPRYEALLRAYGAIVGATRSEWSCGWIEIAGHTAQHCRLAFAGISLVFLAYPDGGLEGKAPNSLLHLWEGKIASASTVSRRPTTYDQRGLIDTLAAIIDLTAPATLRTLEVAATHGTDHADHMIVGALAVLATAASSQDPELVSYRGYNISDEPANMSPALFARSADILGRYEACTRGCAPCGEACAIPTLDKVHRDLLHRRYAIGMRTRASGLLRLGDGCMDVTSAGDTAMISDCATVPTWQLDEHGTLRSSTGLCLRALATGEVIGDTCGVDDPGGRFFLDDDGHLWTGVVPAAQRDMALAHLYCVGVSGGRPRAELCGAPSAPIWELARTTLATPRAATTITRTGRAVRMARLRRGPRAMVCAIEPGARGLMCAPGMANGGLLPAIRIDDRDAPLVIEPESLALGDVDGDAQTDACGRDADGILCATAASGYRAARWSYALGGAGPTSATATATARSLTIAPDGKICGLDDAGVICIGKDATSGTVRSTWPDRRAALWFADLDGDHQADWCTATPAGPACSLASETALSSDGVAWGYTLRGMVEAGMADGAIPDTATAVFTDVDGDGRDDLCMARDGVIVCARSTGHGFGPRSAVARLPAGMVPTSVWAEPARGGREPKVCAADATTIACTD